jgi:hypothetical protein
MKGLVAHPDLWVQVEKMHERSAAGTRVSKKNKSLAVVHKKV